MTLSLYIILLSSYRYNTIIVVVKTSSTIIRHTHTHTQFNNIIIYKTTFDTASRYIVEVRIRSNFLASGNPNKCRRPENQFTTAFTRPEKWSSISIRNLSNGSERVPRVMRSQNKEYNINKRIMVHQSPLNLPDFHLVRWPFLPRRSSALSKSGSITHAYNALNIIKTHILLLYYAYYVLTVVVAYIISRGRRWNAIIYYIFYKAI